MFVMNHKSVYVCVCLRAHLRLCLIFVPSSWWMGLIFISSHYLQLNNAVANLLWYITSQQYINEIRNFRFFCLRKKKSSHVNKTFVSQNEVTSCCIKDIIFLIECIFIFHQINPFNGRSHKCPREWNTRITQTMFDTSNGIEISTQILIHVLSKGKILTLNLLLKTLCLSMQCLREEKSLILEFANRKCLLICVFLS